MFSFLFFLGKGNLHVGMVAILSIHCQEVAFEIRKFLWQVVLVLWPAIPNKHNAYPLPLPVHVPLHWCVIWTSPPVEMAATISHQR